MHMGSCSRLHLIWLYDIGENELGCLRGDLVRGLGRHSPRGFTTAGMPVRIDDVLFRHATAWAWPGCGRVGCLGFGVVFTARYPSSTHLPWMAILVEAKWWRSRDMECFNFSTMALLHSPSYHLLFHNWLDDNADTFKGDTLMVLLWFLHI